MQFIEAITFYHQWQREKKYDTGTGEEYIETTLEDIAAANALMKEVLLRKSDELTGACRYYFERLKKWLKEESKTAFTNHQARTALRENHSNQKRYMIQLQQAGLVSKSKGDQKKGFYYQVVNLEEFERLKSGITGALDTIFSRIGQADQSSQEVQNTNEPLQPKRRGRKPKQSIPSEQV